MTQCPEVALLIFIEAHSPRNDNNIETEVLKGQSDKLVFDAQLAANKMCPNFCHAKSRKGMCPWLRRVMFHKKAIY